MEDTLNRLFQAIVEGDRALVDSSLEAALQAGLDPVMVLNDAMIAAMREVGNRFEAGDYYLPEMLVAARAMKSGMAILEPRLRQAERVAAGRVLIGTVQGDVHEIGKNLVGLMLEGAGFEVRDLGADVPIERFVQEVHDYKPDILAMSALLTTTMPLMKATISAVEQAGLRNHVKIIVGGAPVTETFAQKIGADGFALDASRAVSVARSLVSPAG